MNKDFDGWNEKKKRLDSTSIRDIKNRQIKEGEIYITNIGVNIGTEISCQKDNEGNFLRPCLVLKVINQNTKRKWGSFVGIPLSTKNN